MAQLVSESMSQAINESVKQRVVNDMKQYINMNQWFNDSVNQKMNH